LASHTSAAHSRRRSRKAPPFHWQPEGFRSFLEASLLREPLLGVGAGQWGEEILIAPAHLVQATRAQVVNLTDRDQPVFPNVEGSNQEEAR
jgi:hypothetical protein